MPNIILLHGALGSAAQLEPMKKNLASDFRVYTFDFPGHGGDDPGDGAFRMSDFSQQLEDFISEKNLAPVHVFGYSMGGYAALCLAHQNPELIRSLVTLGTKLEWNPETSAIEASMLNPDKIEEKVPKFAAMLKERHTPGHWKQVLHNTAGMMKALGDNPPLTPETLLEIRIPALLLLGDRDNMVTEAETRNAAQSIPGARFQKLANTPHPIEQVDPEVVAKVVRTFVE